MTESRKTPLRYRWNHRAKLHRSLVKTFNKVASHVPFRLKYRTAMARWTSHAPYSLVGPDSVVVQVGAPADTLRAGRSRGMHLALRTAGGAGRIIIIEPDPKSAEEFTRTASEQGLGHVTVVNLGAWSCAQTLELKIDQAHPATNFVDGLVDYDEARASEFLTLTIEADSIDNILADLGIERVDLVSITTNGAEREILEGLRRTITEGLRYICLARTSDSFDAGMRALGYDFLENDDRGFTYRLRE